MVAFQACSGIEHGLVKISQHINLASSGVGYGDDIMGALARRRFASTGALARRRFGPTGALARRRFGPTGALARRRCCSSCVPLGDPVPGPCMCVCV